ncbi:MAG TPA: hypothetical protein VF092_06240 [Longimicrobium sp.]
MLILLRVSHLPDFSRRTTPVRRRVLIKTSRDGYLATTPHGEATGAAVLRELVDDPLCVAVYQAIRLVTSWFLQPPQQRSDLLDPLTVEALLPRIAGEDPFRDGDPRGALVCILGELTASEPDLRRIALSCLAVADWALSQSAIDTALSFARAAALIGASARYAWVTGRLHREHSRAQQAEIWFQVAYVLAERERDWDIRARSLTSWGHVHLNVGRYFTARDLFQRALSTAQRFQLGDREVEAHHYLFTVARAVSDHAGAMEHSAAAAREYGPDHPRLPYFAHDLACYWMDRGDYQHALEVLLALLDNHFADVPDERLLVRGSSLRAAGGCGRPDVFERLLPAVLDHQRASDSPWVAQALFMAARGAASLKRWDVAETLLVSAIESARSTNQNDTRLSAEDLLAQVRTESHTELLAVYEPANVEVARSTVRALVASSASMESA